MHQLAKVLEFQLHPLEKKVATLSSMIACEIPGTEEPGGLQSVSHKELVMTQRLNKDNNK